ncbi:1-aminocyclopropane-1-carboxylate deaminase/D-cysteine desulfhydrase [Pseudomonas folii]|uniref:Pyridoxal-phosphate dependent enzyme n=1 Tax=Pseudomonas folii TaxID=2762593 RepID=A0ABR7B3X4_9PSED|nr:pyridoxal-phosphate dependent enzyme [Pseudomonas folii]MBC3951862.1 pyridoxal-phosphate dependent enzyme [Pseudomonas folii]
MLNSRTSFSGPILVSISPIHWQPNAPLQRLNLPWLVSAGVEVAVLRLDLIDPLISGNKWFKLAHHLAAASEVNAKGVISLGGAHSNHLHALAAAGKRFGFATVGLLRGHAVETPTTVDLQAFGMQLHWLGYAGYRARHEPDFWSSWLTQYPDFYPIPEGGGGLPGALGCAGLLKMVREQLSDLGWSDYHGWWLAAGTGTTLAGLVLAEEGAHLVYGAMAVPDDHGVEQNVAAILEHCKTGRSELVREASSLTHRLANKFAPTDDYILISASRGGFAKTDPQLLDFIATSESQSGIPLEPLYTGKALMALHDEVVAGRFQAGTRLIFIHTGGLQGRRAMGL